MPVVKCYQPQPSARLITRDPDLDYSGYQVQVLVEDYLLQIYLAVFLKTNLTKFAVI